MDVNRLCLGCFDDRGDALFCPHCGWKHTDQPESPLYLPPGFRLNNGRYVLGRVVGHGGFGITYLGWDINLERKIAVKEYFPSGVAIRTTGSPAVFPYTATARNTYQWGLDRYLDEARVVARFENHPNVVWVKDYFPEHGTAYMVLEFLDGASLDSYLAQQENGRIPFPVALRLLLPIMEALREVHRTGILHRDISPDNIYLLRNGSVKLIDFGAARSALRERSQNLSIILKPGYAPPEQYQSKGNQGPWTDVYALAGTFYKALTGQVPAPAPDRMGLSALAPPSSFGIKISPSKEAVLLKALALRAEDRYQDMDAFVHALTQPDSVAPPIDVKPKPAPVPPPAPVPQPSPRPLPPGPVRPPLAFPPWLRFVIGLGVGAIAILFAVYLRAKPPKIVTFSAEKSSVTAGEQTVLRWNVQDAQQVTIDNGVGLRPAFGDAYIAPTESTVYTLLATGKGGRTTESKVTVEVTRRSARREPPQPEPPSPRPQPQPWRDRIEPPTPSPDRDRSRINPLPYQQQQQQQQQQQYQQQQERQRPQPQFAELVSFAADPTRVVAGTPVRLTWEVKNARRLYLSPEPGLVPLQGSVTVQPLRTNRYTLMAEGDNGIRPVGQVMVIVDRPTNLRPDYSDRQQPYPPVYDPGQQQQQQRQIPRPVTGATWNVIHDHAGAIAFNPRDWDRCQGTLTVAGGHVIYNTREPGHSFDVAVSQIAEAQTNRLPIRRYRAFHIKIGGRNYNFIPMNENPGTIVNAISSGR